MLLQNPLTHEVWRLCDPATLTGTVTRIGYYGDTILKLIIAMSKRDFYPCIIGEGVCHPAILYINGDMFAAGLRTTARSATVMVCPDIVDSAGQPARLADVLFQSGIVSTSQVHVSLESGPAGIIVNIGDT
jgi:hypothetical protein